MHTRLKIEGFTRERQPGMQDEIRRVLACMGRTSRGYSAPELQVIAAFLEGWPRVNTGARTRKSLVKPGAEIQPAVRILSQGQ